MTTKKFYAAIDFGTTNSAFAFGKVNAQNQFKPTILDIDRKNEIGSISRNALLPSCVTYFRTREGQMEPVIGDYARSRYGLRQGYTSKSVKSLLGVTDRVPLVAEIPDKTPSDVAARIIEFMLKSSRQRLFQPELSDVIITVPASYSSDQVQATLDAARKAGINTNNDDHDILLHEPTAVLYNYIRMTEADETAETEKLSFDDGKKIVLVFDLGGGTLDVSLHQVGYKEDHILSVTDIAISRYTRFGGDDFDELLALDMLERFEEDNHLTILPHRREEVLCRLRKLAEKVKIDLSLSYENAKMADTELPDNYKLPTVYDLNLYDAYAFEATYTKGEIENIFSGLMGYQLRKEDLNRIQHIGEADMDNMIYPILDVLEKAGGEMKIDGVLLNGGMTKFYLIKDRIRSFFGFEPIVSSDPDLSVALGASYYHYCLHKYGKQEFFQNTILNDTLNLGLRGEYVSELVPAGTQLPYRSGEIRDKYYLMKKSNSITIDLFLGRGKSKNLPNRRIAMRTAGFDRVFPAGTPVSFEFEINALKIIRVSAWITDHPETKTLMSINMNASTDNKNGERNITTNALELNPKSELCMLRQLVPRRHKCQDKISSIITSIKSSSNPEDFFGPCFNSAQNCKQGEPLLGYLYKIASEIGSKWNVEERKQFAALASKHFEFNPFVLQTQINQMNALELIQKFDVSPKSKQVLEQYLNDCPSVSDKIKAKIDEVIKGASISI